MADDEAYRPPAGRSNPAIHNDLDCPNLEKSRKLTGKEPIGPKPLSVYPDWMKRCPLCFGGDPA